MAEAAAVSLARQHVLSKISEVVKMLRDLPKEVADISEELESFQDFINDADKVAAAEKDKNKRDINKKRVMRLREAVFRMEDVIDEYMIFEEKQPDDPRCAALLCEAVDYIKTMIFRLQIAYEIGDVKSLVQGLKAKYGLQSKLPLEQRPNSSRGNENVPSHNLRMNPLLSEKDKVVVVGLDGPRNMLKNWLTEGRKELTVISIVGSPGVGKSTLAKHVFDMVHKDFDRHALITVSQSYTPEGLLKRILDELCNEKMEDTPRNVSAMGRESLIKEVQKHLHNKRYVILFDDVWNETFWDDIESAVIDDKNESRILITTRNLKVAAFCKKSSFTEVHKLENPLNEEESLKLFHKKAFWYRSDGCCPDVLKDVSLEIVRKCKGLPLAIVAIGGLLSQKDISAPEWGRFSKNGSLELASVTEILSLSYADLPDHLRSCLLYFGMYPEDYEVKSSRLIKQWVAEGFVKHEGGKTLEEVAQEYLIELITRSLVQVSSFNILGKATRCRVHDSIHEMILGKIKDTGFCQHIDEHNELVSSGIVRRLIAAGSNDLIGNIERSHIRSILIFPKEELSEHFMSGILAKYMPLKVLDSEDARLYHVPKYLGNLIHLKYLSFRNTRISSLPKSIGKLQNLETLDVRQTLVSEMPKEISKLRKLSHLLADKISRIQLGGLTSLQKIRFLNIEYYDEVVIRDLGKLTQLRDLCLTVCRSLPSSSIYAEQGYEKIDLDGMSPKTTLRKLCLHGGLKKLPNCIPGLQNLVKLSLISSKLTNDPLKSLKDMPNLLFLCISTNAYEGETLHFEYGGFQKLKQLVLECLFNLNSIIIDRGALDSLEKLELAGLPELKAVPSGIQHLKKLGVVYMWVMQSNIWESIHAYNEEQKRWLIQGYVSESSKTILHQLIERFSNRKEYKSGYKRLLFQMKMRNALLVQREAIKFLELMEPSHSH